MLSRIVWMFVGSMLTVFFFAVCRILAS